MLFLRIRSAIMIKIKVFPYLSNQKYNIMNKSYEEAVQCINSLQSNTSYLKNAPTTAILPHSAIFSTTIAETEKYLLRTGITLDDLNKLSVIHIAGTKGKGSVCAFCESIIREYGYKTGFYSSPHIIEVRERIKINGKPISKEMFAENVIKIFNKLMDQREHSNDMPAYFRFLTIVAFNIFLAEKIDCAIIEVGIGGEYDCTNILRNTPIVGITSLGIDHVKLLGDSLEEISWQKAGIMKKNSKVFTVEQKENAMKILRKRSLEKKVNSFEVVQNFNEYIWNNGPPVLGINGDIQKVNASLAIQLSHNWLKYCGGYKNLNIETNTFIIPEKSKIGLEKCKWPGRNQILKTETHKFYLDGAHTIESLEICAEWFKKSSTSKYKVLIFNLTGNRDSENLLKTLINIDFDCTMFVPNTASSRNTKIDQINLINTDQMQLYQCQINKNIWEKLQKNKLNNKNNFVLPDVETAIKKIPRNQCADVLITGSLHLIGASLTLLDPDLKTF